MTSLKDYLTVKEASELLNVSPSTLRLWDKQGKLKPRRHPLNNYRLYYKKDLENLIKQITKKN